MYRSISALIALILLIACGGDATPVRKLIGPPAVPGFDAAAIPICRSSTGTWQNITTPTYTADHTTEFDVTPSTSAVDGMVGTSEGWAAAAEASGDNGSLHTGGKIQALDANTYKSVSVVSYTGGTKYHVRMTISFTDKKYSAFVKVGAGAEQTLATNYRFRSAQSTETKQDNLGFRATTGNLITCYGDSGTPAPPDTTTPPVSPTMTSFLVEPESVGVAPRGTQSFGATVTWSDSVFHPYTVAWSATGGTISSTGLYTAGTAAGSFNVIGSSSGRVDTSKVTITAPDTTTASVSGCPTSGFLRRVDVSTASGVTSAVAAALPGDQIRLAPGLYNFVDAITMTRSGTAANKIMLCGPRTAVLHVWVDMKASYWWLRGFRITGQGIYTNKIKNVLQSAGTNNVYDSLEMDHSNAEAIGIHTTSTGNEVKYNYIHDTGIVQPQYGEGIYIGNGTDYSQHVNNNHIHHNRLVHIAAEGIENKEGSDYNTIDFNTVIDASYPGTQGSIGPIAIRGSHNTVSDNILDQCAGCVDYLGAIINGSGGNGDLTIHGNYNVYHRNQASNIPSNKVFRFEPGHTGNEVYCDNIGVAPVVLGVSCITTPPPSTSCTRTVNVTTVSNLTAALSGAQPGDCINLAAGTYSLSSNLTFSKSGTAALPIVIEGAGWGSTIIDGNGNQIYIQSSNTKIRKMRFTDLGVQGLWLQGVTYSTFDSLEIDNTKQIALAFKDASHHNTIKNSKFHDTGTLYSYYGEAIYVGNSGSDAANPIQTTNTDNQILNNHFGPNVRANHIDIKPGSDRTLFKGNTLDGTGTVWDAAHGMGSLVDVNASGTIIEDNVMQYGSPNAVKFFAPAGGLPAMTGSVAQSNSIDLQNIHSATVAYYGFNLTTGTTSPSAAAIKCNNTVTNGPFSNVSCVPDTPPPGGCARTVNVTTVANFTTALSSSQPGDCINVAAGTYSLSTGMEINRSGTAGSSDHDSGSRNRQYDCRCQSDISEYRCELHQAPEDPVH